MRKIICCFVISFLAVYNCFAGLKYLESICVVNMTDRPVYLTYELKNGPSDPLRNYSFDVIIQDKCFTIEDYLFNSSDRSVRPDYIYTILKYNYKDSSGKRIYDFQYVDCIPFMEKMLSIYSKLEIKTESGKVLLNLDILPQINVRRYRAGNLNTYMIEIHDFNETGKIIPQKILSADDLIEKYFDSEKTAEDW